MRNRRSRRELENNNFKRQAQAVTILTIATVILGGALFQVDISINNLFSTTQPLVAVDEFQLGQPQQVFRVTNILGGALGGHLSVLPEKAGQLQLFQVVFQ